ncbi:hypothetical protein JL720_1270 [Aureococcus anophagefferens]|nr:hypothetical protein JL720_1270 [Aureococcus anophagefferens]
MLRRLVAVAWLGAVASYKWDISDTYGQEKLSFSELYQYGTDDGPFPVTRGASYVLVDLEGQLSNPYSSANVTVLASCGVASFACFLAYFFALLVIHRDKLLPLHYAIFAAALLAAAEAGAWFFSYLSMNASGAPLCCPFPSHVIAAMTLEFLRRTLTRALLLVVSLGHGVVRASLTTRGAGVALLLLGYLVSSIVATVTKVEESSDLHSGSKASTTSDLPVLFFDLCFLVWIYMALLYWLQTVSLEILNFAVIAAVTVIWKPTEHAQLLVTMQRRPRTTPRGRVRRGRRRRRGAELAETAPRTWSNHR